MKCKWKFKGKVRMWTSLFLSCTFFNSLHLCKAQAIDVSDINTRLNQKLNHTGVSYRYKNLFGFYTGETGVVVLGLGVEGQEFPSWDTSSAPKMAEVISSTRLAQEISSIKGIDKKLPFTLLIYKDGNSFLRHSTLNILDNTRSIHSLKKSEPYYFLINGVYNSNGDSISRMLELRRNIINEGLNDKLSKCKLLHFELIPDLGCLASIACSDIDDEMDALMNFLLNEIHPYLERSEKVIFHITIQDNLFEHLIIHDLKQSTYKNYILSE